MPGFSIGLSAPCLWRMPYAPAALGNNSLAVMLQAEVIFRRPFGLKKTKHALSKLICITFADIICLLSQTAMLFPGIMRESLSSEAGVPVPVLPARDMAAAYSHDVAAGGRYSHVLRVFAGSGCDSAVKT